MADRRIRIISLENHNEGPIRGLTSLPYGVSVLVGYLRQKGVSVSVSLLLSAIQQEAARIWPLFFKRLAFDIVYRSQEVLDHVRGIKRSKHVASFAEEIYRLAGYQNEPLVGISVMSKSAFLMALLLAERIKASSTAKVVLGGPFVTTFGRELFDYCPGDYLVMGDGQEALLRLLEHASGKGSLEDIPGLIYRKDGKVEQNPAGISLFDAMPMPDLSDAIQILQNIGDIDRIILPYQLTRGCRNRCSFCTNFRASPKVEFKSVNKVVRELKEMKKKFNERLFYFCDDAVNNDVAVLERYCDAFISEKLDIVWGAYARADNLGPDLLLKMKKAGCVFLKFGVESGSNVVLRRLDKGVTADQVARVVKDAYSAGIKTYVNFIVGSPHEQRSDVEDTVQWIKDNSPYIYQVHGIYRFLLMPRTKLYQDPERFGIENIRIVYFNAEKCPISYFGYDEIQGLSWRERKKEMERAFFRVLWAKYKYTVLKSSGFCGVLWGFYAFLCWGARNFRERRLRLPVLKNVANYT